MRGVRATWREVYNLARVLDQHGGNQQRNRESPIGTIDPALKLIALFDNDQPLAALAYYATHPQSYYRTGGANPDFPGMARDTRECVMGVFHLHFTGAAGNVGAGKWNDGSPPYRQILADRLAAAMQRAWKACSEPLYNRPTWPGPSSPSQCRWQNTCPWPTCGRS